MSITNYMFDKIIGTLAVHSFHFCMIIDFYYEVRGSFFLILKYVTAF